MLFVSAAGESNALGAVVFAICEDDDDPGKATLQRKFPLCIPEKGIARPQSQFLHSCVYEPVIYSDDQSTYFAVVREVISNDIFPKWIYQNNLSVRLHSPYFLMYNLYLY